MIIKFNLNLKSEKADFLSQALLILSIFTVIFPMNLIMPGLGLDPSWVLVTNEALSKGLKFGVDFIYTYGPFSSIHTQAYHPNTIKMTIVLGLLLSSIYIWVINQLIEGSAYKNLIKIFFSIIFISLFYGVNHYSVKIFIRDSLFYGLIFYINLILLKKINFKKVDFQLNTALLISSLAAISLVKVSFLLASCLSLLIVSLGNNKKILLFFLTYISSMFFFWVCAGQNYLDLIPYISNSVKFSSLYSESMSSDISAKDLPVLIFFILVSSFLLLESYKISSNKLSLLSNLLITFFVFKASFVRHDLHETIAFGFLVLIAFSNFSQRYTRGNFILLIISLIILSQLPDKVRLLLIVCVSFFYFFLLRANKKLNLELATLFTISLLIFYSSHFNLQKKIKDSFNGISVLIKNKSELQNVFNENIRIAAGKCKLPSLNGMSDYYGWDSICLIGSNNYWKPRPVFQSLGSFDSKLIKKNEQNLRGQNAIKNVFFENKSIDNRYPLLEDSLSWLAIFDNYIYVSSYLKNDKEKIALFVKKYNYTHSNFRILDNRQYKTNEKIILPYGHNNLFVRFYFHKTFFGSICNLLFKIPKIEIEVTYSNLNQKVYRLIPKMAEAGFLLSPTIESTDEFINFSKKNILISNEITSFKILSNNLFWENTFESNIAEYQFKK